VSKERAERLLRMAAALEESITRLEAQKKVDTQTTVLRLRLLQKEILSAIDRADSASRGH
jgi:uncharacterized protein HemX